MKKKKKKKRSAKQNIKKVKKVSIPLNLSKGMTILNVYQDFVKFEKNSL